MLARLRHNGDAFQHLVHGQPNATRCSRVCVGALTRAPLRPTPTRLAVGGAKVVEDFFERAARSACALRCLVAPLALNRLNLRRRRVLFAAQDTEPNARARGGELEWRKG
jgi:hypothetical protein